MDNKPITAEDVAELQKALSVGSSPFIKGHVLQVTTFPASKLTMWPGVGVTFDANYESYTKQTNLRQYVVIADMLRALSKVHIIRDAFERDSYIYWDARPYVE